MSVGATLNKHNYSQKTSLTKKNMEKYTYINTFSIRLLKYAGVSASNSTYSFVVG